MKQKKTQAFTHLGNYEWIDELLELVLLLSEDDWDEFTFRQKNIIGHEQTQTIPLMFDHEQKSRDIRHRHYDTYVQHLGKLSTQLASLDFPAMVKRANLVRLMANAKIAPHLDYGIFLNSTRRVHVPITTNQNCLFTVGNESKHLPKGEMWEINNTGLIHSVINGGDTPRIHLIVDVG